MRETYRFFSYLTSLKRLRFNLVEVIAKDRHITLLLCLPLATPQKSQKHFDLNLNLFGFFYQKKISIFAFYSYNQAKNQLINEVNVKRNLNRTDKLWRLLLALICLILALWKNSWLLTAIGVFILAEVC